MAKYDPNRVFIRAKNKIDRWDSLPISEVQSWELLNWYSKMVLSAPMNLELSLEQRQKMLDFMEEIGVELVQLKKME